MIDADRTAGTAPPHQIEMWAVDKLRPYERNARQHAPEQVTSIAASIDRFGFCNPILIDGQAGIIAGHGRLLAAKELGLTEVPVVVLDHLSPEERRAYVLADNRLAELATWDEELLAAELAALREEDFDLSLLGWTDDELAEIADGVLPGSEPDAEPDFSRAEELREKWNVQPGQVWTLGRHRIACGDSTDAADVARCLGGVEPFLMVSDPPYGVNYDPEWRNEGGLNRDTLSNRTGAVTNDNNPDWTEAWKLFPGAVAYVWHASLFCNEVARSLDESGFILRSQIVWAKRRFAISRGHYHWQHESCLYAYRHGEAAKWNGSRTETTVWDIASTFVGDGDDAPTIHSTQKPVECMERPIRNHGGKEDVVYDPFLGSGTTIIAAERLGRTCVGLELDPKYVAITLERWATMTGNEPRTENGRQEDA